VLVSNYFDISTLDYFIVSAQMQLQYAVWLCRTGWLCGLHSRSAKVSFLESRFRTLIGAWTFVV